MKWEQAVAALQRAVELSQCAPVAAACLGEAYAAAGASDEARKVLQELTSRPHVTAYFVSRIYAALGDTNEAFKWLEISYQEHGEWMVLLPVDPRWDSVRDDARFQDLMRRMNFPRTSEDQGPTHSLNPLP
jgi:tetratricopeptide (TPR) repeat protein